MSEELTIRDIFPDIRRTSIRRATTEITIDGREIRKVFLNDGTTLIAVMKKSGVVVEERITIPDWGTFKERNEIILDLLADYTQDEVAGFMDISQSTVSKVYRQWRDKEDDKE